MRVEDQRQRRLVMKKNGNNKAKYRRLRQIDSKNTKVLKKIIKLYGWPNFDLVGEETAHSFWLLVQHADHDHSFQHKCLDLITKAAGEQQATLKDVAYLTDRLLVADNKKQKFGTQFIVKDQKLILRPVVNPKLLDKRRREFGLSTMREYLKSANEAFKKYSS